MCTKHKYKFQVWIHGCLDMCDWKKTVLIPITPALLLPSRHFISFPFCWFWFTPGSQRAPSKGGELHPWRSVRADICSFWRLEMIWNQSWLIQYCLGFTESVHKDDGLRARVCNCVVSVCLCIPPVLRYSVLYLLSWYFCLSDLAGWSPLRYTSAMCSLP